MPTSRVPIEVHDRRFERPFHLVTTYNDGQEPSSITQKYAEDGSGTLVSTTHYDKMGHVSFTDAPTEEALPGDTSTTEATEPEAVAEPEVVTEPSAPVNPFGENSAV